MERIGDMNDVKRLCGRCRHEHDYGVLRYSQDNVKFYGARGCPECNCSDFVEAHEGVENALSLPSGELRQLWEDTAFLSAQTPMATRIAVRQLETLDGGERDKAFMGLMISQVTDIRAALTKDESKFANLVGHTDEIVDSMKGVVQLNERLTGVNLRIDDTNERIDRLAVMLNAIAEKMGVEVKQPEHPDPASEVDASKGARRPFTTANTHMRDSIIVADSTPIDEGGN